MEITTAELAAVLGISTRTARDLCKQRGITPRVVGHVYLWPEEAVDVLRAHGIPRVGKWRLGIKGPVQEAARAVREKRQ